jgi:hypothetical protein
MRWDELLGTRVKDRFAATEINITRDATMQQ